MRGLVAGGADLLLIETIFDTLNGKAAIGAIKEVAPDLPLFISVTIVDRSGRNLSGQTVEAFWTSVEHAEPFAAGVNCSLGATEMRPYIADLSRVAPVYVICYPNAGLPNAFGGYDEQPPMTSRLLKEFAESGFLNAAGGCCGTGPEHVRQIRKAMESIPPRHVPKRPARTRFSGLEPFEIGPDTNFVLVGERTNVTGSARFRRLIESGDYTGAVAVALDRPGISLIGYSDPRRTGPYRQFHDLIIDAYHDSGEESPVSMKTRTGRMQNIQVSDVESRLEIWNERYRA